MKKKQLILIGVGVLTVAVLYLLPKVVVDNEATGAKMESEATASSSISASFLLLFPQRCSAQNIIRDP